MGSIKGVIFDLDNTLLDFIAMKEKAVEAASMAMIDAGLPLTMDEVQRKVFSVYELEGIEFQNVFDKLLKDTLGHVDPRILSAGIVAYRRVREAMLVPYPHVRSTLIGLIKRGLKLAVVSDAPAMQAWLRLAYLQIGELFDAVVTFDDTGEWKPSPKPFREGLKRLDIKPEEAIMIGDWVDRDLKGAKSLGMLTVHARYGSEVPPEKPSPDADVVIDDIGDLLQIVDRWS